MTPDLVGSDGEAEAIAAGLRKHIHPEHFSGFHPERVDVEVVDAGEVHATLVYENERKGGMMVVQRGTGLLQNQWHHGFVKISEQSLATISELTHAAKEAFTEAHAQYNRIF
jgi:hypothetical protein